MKRLYFCGGAFGSAYYIGVLKALQERQIRPKYVYGNSAGALFALLCLLEMPTDAISELFTPFTPLLIQNAHSVGSYE
jgi:predicted acylesterase/phospholipase RssA